MTKHTCCAIALRQLDEATRQGLAVDNPDLAGRLNGLLGTAIALVGAEFPPETTVHIAACDRPRSLPLPTHFVGLDDLSEVATGRDIPHRIAGGVIHLPPGGAAVLRWRRRPAAMAPDAPDDTPVDLPDAALPLVALRLSALVAAPENPALSAHLMNLYAHAAAALRPAPLPPRAAVAICYDWGDDYGL